MFSIHDVCRVLDAPAFLENPSILIQGAAIDSRCLEPGNLFIAIKTAKDDGHRYLRDAFLKGASAALIGLNFLTPAVREEMQKNPQVFHNLIPVPDPVTAFTSLAFWHRNRTPLKAIGITGSVGKTSTKEFLTYILRRKCPVHGTEGNLNNHLGLPLTLFKLQPSHRFCVAEMGANQKGDISGLAAVLRPDAGILTQVSPAHLRGFGTLKDTYDAKCELMLALNPGSPIVLPENDNLLIARAQKRDLRVIRVGYSMKSDYIISDVRTDRSQVSFTLNHQWKFCFPGVAAFLAKNAAMAIAMAEAYGISCEEVAGVWSDFKLPKGRFQERWYQDGTRVVDDSYNASPLSFSRALEAFAKLPVKTGKRVVVFADMLELGKDEKRYHEDLGRQMARYSFDLVLGYGVLAKHAIDVLKTESSRSQGVHFFDTSEEAAEFLLQSAGGGDSILMKASRGMKIEKVIHRLEEKIGSPLVSQT